MSQQSNHKHINSCFPKNNYSSSMINKMLKRYFLHVSRGNIPSTHRDFGDVHKKFLDFLTDRNDGVKSDSGIKSNLSRRERKQSLTGISTMVGWPT